MFRLPVVLLAALPLPVWAQLSDGTWRTDVARHSVPWTELVSAGPKKDAIPSIDHPKFVSVSDAAAWISENEPVIAVEIAGEARAYPLQILIWHLLAADSIGGTPILISYSVLCNSAVVFDRRVAGATYEFGFSGMVRNSNVVMFDRQTESLWQQLTGGSHRRLFNRRETCPSEQPSGAVQRLPPSPSRREDPQPRNRIQTRLRNRSLCEIHVAGTPSVSSEPARPASRFPPTETLVIVQAGGCRPRLRDALFARAPRSRKPHRRPTVRHLLHPLHARRPRRPRDRRLP